MAAPSVTADVTRVAQGNITPDTGIWGNDGGGGGVANEVDSVYQNTTSQSRKVGTSILGRSYTHGSGTDMDGTPVASAHYIAKINATNNSSMTLRTDPGMHMKLGSSSTDYHTYWLFGRDNYPPRGGWQIVAIAPSVAGYAAEVGDTGSPNDSAILYWSVLGDFVRVSKSENVVIDAIDVGLGLFLVGGDGVSADATFQDFIDYDEGTLNNRYGFVFTEGPVLFATGQLTIGETSSGTATHTDFTDDGVTVVWTNGLVLSGFHKFRVNISATGTVIQMNNCSFLSQGKDNNDGDRGYTTTEDSRPVFETSGNIGSATFTACVFNNWSSFGFGTARFDGCTFADCGQAFSVVNGRLKDCFFSGYTGAADTSYVSWGSGTNPDTWLSGSAFTAHPTILSHAIEFGLSSPTTINLTDVIFTGYSSSNNVNDSMIHIKRTTGTVTINVSGGTSPSYRTDGAAVVVVNAVTILITAIDASDGATVSGARLSLEAAPGGDLAGSLSTSITSVGTTATATATLHGLTTGDTVIIRGALELEYNGIFSVTVTGVNTFTYTIVATTSPATGTITSTAQILEGLTDGSGIVTTTGFNFTTDQPITGRLRRGTTSTLYKTAGISGDINVSGFTANVAMVRDE